MNIKQRLREIAEDLKLIADDHPTQWPPVNLEVEARPDGSLVCKQVGADEAPEVLPPHCSFGSANFRVRNVSEPRTAGGFTRAGLFAYFDQMTEHGRIVTTADWLADVGMLIANDAARGLTNVNNSKVDSDLIAAIRRVASAYEVEGRSPAYHQKQKARLYREWPMLDAAIQGLIREYRHNPPFSLFDPPAAASLINSDGQEVAREPYAWRSLEDPAGDEVQPPADVLTFQDVYSDEAVKDSNYEIRKHPDGPATVYWQGCGKRPDAYKHGEGEFYEFRLCSNCDRWFAGPAKLDLQNTFCGEGCQNEHLQNEVETEAASVVLRSARKPEPIGSIESPADPDYHANVAVCGNCEKRFDLAKGFKWTKGLDDAKLICSVDCLATAAGLLPNE